MDFGTLWFPGTVVLGHYKSDTIRGLHRHTHLHNAAIRRYL